METKGEKFVYKAAGILEKFIDRQAKFLKKASHELKFLKYKLAFGERDDDIYIVSFPKSGTTLMQMLLYQLTTDGNMNFRHIYDVSPWIRNDAIRGIAPRTLPSPRLIKTHDVYSDFDPEIKGRFIFMYRNGMDVAVSYYHQEVNYNHPDLTFDEFISKRFFREGERNYFSFNKDWFENKKRLPILYVSYESMLENFGGVIKEVVRFCNIGLHAKNLPRITERCSFEFMKAQEDKFGEQPVPKKQIFDQFIRNGKTGEGEQYFSPEQRERFIGYFKKELEPYERKIFKRPVTV